MKKTGMWRVISIAMFAITLASVVIGSAAANTVPTTKASDTTRAITVNTLKPAACAGITLTTLVAGNGSPLDGGATNDLVLGGPAAQSVRGNGGDDCLLGGGGDDNVRGDGDADICIGGPGTDSFHPSCETQVQ